MYSRQEASLLTEQFWTSFGKYMSPVLSAEGEQINWVNYKTGKKPVRFIMEVVNRSARIAIRIVHKDPVLHEVYFNKFLQLQPILREFTGEEWNRDFTPKDDPIKNNSEIYTSLNEVNIFDKGDWPAIISFFKPRIIALDLFWSEYKYAFEDLA